MLTYTSIRRTIRCLVWLIPADSNWFSNRADEDPTDSIRTEIRGPRPASRGEPVRLPTGMDNSLAET